MARYLRHFYAIGSSTGHVTRHVLYEACLVEIKLQFQTKIFRRSLDGEVSQLFSYFGVLDLLNIGELSELRGKVLPSNFQVALSCKY